MLLNSLKMKAYKTNPNNHRSLRKKLPGLVALFLLITATSSLFVSCKKFIEVDPPYTGLRGNNVYTSDQTAAAVLTDIYASMSAANIRLTSNNITSVSLYLSLAADELTLYDLNTPDLANYYRNDLNKSSIPNYWESIYSQIFAANNAIDGLTNSTSLSTTVKQQLLGEAKFVRAFFYFYLVNMYGDIPLVLNLDYKVNALLPRAPVATVYKHIINDLQEAESLMSDIYLKGDASTAYTSGGEERVRPTRWAATAMLARAYLYTGDYVNAEIAATTLINHASLYRLTPLSESFLKNNKEAIWQLQPIGTEERANTGEGRLFVLPSTGPGAINPVYLNTWLLNSFETDDLRKTNWIDSVVAGGNAYYYAQKYKIGNVASPTLEYPTILRLAEQYLIRAEARAAKNDIQGAQNDLNIIRIRAGLPNTAAATKPELLNAILGERQRELFTEWGHRWFDLKRSGRIDKIMSVVTPTKNGTWQPYQALFPIPQTDIDRAPNLSQNPGYN
jgi:hypothetical protein